MSLPRKRLRVWAELSAYLDNETAPVQLFDVSGGGCALAPPAGLRAGQAVTVIVYLPCHPEPLRLPGEVRWVKSDRAGVAFLGLTPAQEAALAGYVKDHTPPAPGMEAPPALPRAAPGKPPAAQPADSDIAAVIAAWPSLPARARRTILAVVEVATAVSCAP